MVLAGNSSGQISVDGESYVWIPEDLVMNASSFDISRPNGAGNSIGGPASMLILPVSAVTMPKFFGARATAHLTPHSYSAVWSSLAARSRNATSGAPDAESLMTRGLISR